MARNDVMLISSHIVSTLVSSLSSVENSPPFVESSVTSPSSTDIFSNSDDSCDIEKPFGLRREYHNHPLVGFLNINSLRNKIIDLRILMEGCLPDVLVIEETKICFDFKTETFHVNNYQYLCIVKGCQEMCSL